MIFLFFFMKIKFRRAALNAVKSIKCILAEYKYLYYMYINYFVNLFLRMFLLRHLMRFFCLFFCSVDFVFDIIGYVFNQRLVIWQKFISHMLKARQIWQKKSLLKCLFSSKSIKPGLGTKLKPLENYALHNSVNPSQFTWKQYHVYKFPVCYYEGFQGRHRCIWQSL